MLLSPSLKSFGFLILKANQSKNRLIQKQAFQKDSC